MSDQLDRASVGEQARERIIRLVDFLKDYDAQKNPPVTDIAKYQLFSLPGEKLPAVPGVTLTPGAATWLTVAFVDRPAMPPVPEELLDYLPQEERLSPIERPTPTIPPSGYLEPDPADANEDTAPALTEEATKRLAAANEWVDTRWTEWSTQWNQAEQAKELYRHLFEQQQLIANDRETYELVWGFGRLGWSAEGTTVNHPLFTVVVEVESDAESALSIQPVEPLEAETLPFATISVADRAALSAIREAVANDPFDPWTSEVLTSRTRSMVRSLHHEGVLADEGLEQANAPVSDTGWVLFTRRRRPDRQGFLDAMRDLYAAGIRPPDALSSIVVDAPSAYENTSESASEEVNPEPLLLPLPSNEEQQRILTLAQRQSGVIVQGPPGTGKSHTIANLVSHYVAYGHRVLVVAEKEQALTVLGDKIPEQVRPLAVSVLGADQVSRRALETAITSIQGRVSNLDRSFEDRRIKELTADLNATDTRIAEATSRLMQTRQSETNVLPGEWPVSPASPERVAAWVAQHSEKLNYIPDRLPTDLPPPLSAGELAELLRLLIDVGLERARDSAYVLPELSYLPDQADLAGTIGRRDQLRATLSAAAPEIADWVPIDAAHPATITELRGRLATEVASIAASTTPWVAAISRQLRDPYLVQDWQRFQADVYSDRQQILGLRPQLAAHQVELPADLSPAFLTDLEQARTRLAERGKLGLFGGGAKRALEACRVDGAIPATAEAVALCQQAIHLAALRRQLRTRWLNQIVPCGAPDLDSPRPEDSVGLLLERLSDLLSAPERWRNLVSGLHQIGVTVRGDYNQQTLARLLQVVDLIPARAQERAANQQLDALYGYLRDGARQRQASSLWQQLADALAAERLGPWQQHRDEVAELADVSIDARRLLDLYERLSAAAPVWMNAIQVDQEAAGEPARLPEAWQWRQLDTWVGAIANGESPQYLQRQLEELTVQRRHLVAELVGVQAWRRLADNLGDRQRQALNQYLAATRRFGKTGGKFAARWLAEIRDALNRSKDAVPVWVMTTARALASFRPDAEPPFDVLVIDEASQIGIEALPLLALAKRAIVVGDDKQTSPAAVGVDQESIFGLIDSHLADVEGHRVMFNPGNSLYDLARQKFPSLVMLREHFRSLPEIIAYSNTTFYGDKIEPLREDRPSPGWSALGAVKVLDGVFDRRTDTNDAEANVVVDVIAKLIDDPAYDGMDFGVVCLRAGAQSQLIYRRLFDRLGPQVMTERRLRVGDAANFQGDERDVMLVSTVAATDPANPTGRIRAMTTTADEQRINVAASRARDQMIVVHSLDPDQFPTNDLRAGLIRHCRSPFEPETDAFDALARCDSEFERMVLRRIVARGYHRVRSQVHVGTDSRNYRIDLVVDGRESRLAVECDGERWHGEDRWHADRARQEVLERAGWTFCRIRGSAFFRDPDAALEPLWARLDELGILPEDDQPNPGRPAAMLLELRGTAPALHDSHLLA